jgi:hypothetical protein
VNAGRGSVCAHARRCRGPSGCARRSGTCAGTGCRAAGAPACTTTTASTALREHRSGNGKTKGD